MASWHEMSLDNLDAAQALYQAGNLRSSVNRSYYSAYCAAAAEVIKRNMTFAHGWHNPSHDQLPELILNNTDLPRETRWRINKFLRLLRAAREDADYRPGRTIDHALALACVHGAGDVLRLLEVRP